MKRWDSISESTGERRLKRILLVDDDVLLSDLLSHTLRQAGYDVAVAANGVEALARLSREPADLIITDVVMPKMDGFMLLSQIRSGPTTWRIPVILLTTRSATGEVVTGAAQGAQDYLVKPFRPHMIVARVARVAQTSVGNTPTPTQTDPRPPGMRQDSVEQRSKTSRVYSTASFLFTAATAAAMLFSCGLLVGRDLSGGRVRDGVHAESPPSRVSMEVSLPPLFAVQVAALQVQTVAQDLAARLLGKGWPAYVVDPKKNDPDALFRIRVGPYGDRAEANRIRRHLQAEEHLQPWVVPSPTSR